MRGKLMFIGGLAAGFVLGSRAGREKYEEIAANAKKVWEHPTVQEAAGVAQAQANKLYSEGKDKLGQTKIGRSCSPAQQHDDRPRNPRGLQHVQRRGSPRRRATAPRTEIERAPQDAYRRPARISGPAFGVPRSTRDAGPLRGAPG